MSNEELIKQFYVAFKNKDEKTCLKLCDENIEWITMDEMPNGGTYNGKKQVFENYFPNMLSHFKEFHAIPEQITGLKDHVTVTGRYHGVSKQDKEFDVSCTSMAIHQFQLETAKKILQEMTRISKNIIVLDYNYPVPRNFYGFAAKTIESMAGKEHHRNFKTYIKHQWGV